MIPACFDYQDPADTEPGADQIGDGWDGEETEVSEPDQWTLAAMSGEGGTVTDDQIERMATDLRLMETNVLVALRYKIETELKRRVESYEREAKAARMALENIKPRAKRSDAGTTRRKVEAA